MARSLKLEFLEFFEWFLNHLVLRETTMNSMSALNGTQFVGALAIFGFISLFYWIVRHYWRCYFHQSEFVKIQDAVADL